MVARLRDAIQRGTNAARPAATAVDVGTLYYDTTNSSLGRSTGAAWESVEGAAGLADMGNFTYLDATEAAAPATPAANKVRIYAKADGRVYSKDDAGVESGPFSSGGGATDPLLYADDVALHADGDTFSNTALPGWTKVGSGSATAVTTEPYDATCIDLIFAASGDRIHKAVPPGLASSGNFELSLTFHGINNTTPSPLAAAGGMMGLYIADGTGAGTVVCPYDDGVMYLMALAGNAYSATGPIITGGWRPLGVAAASNMPIVIKLRRVGTTITGYLSHNGGLTFTTNTRTDSATFTRWGIIRAYVNGGTDPRLRLGRVNVVEL